MYIMCTRVLNLVYIVCVFNFYYYYYIIHYTHLLLLLILLLLLCHQILVK